MRDIWFAATFIAVFHVAVARGLRSLQQEVGNSRSVEAGFRNVFAQGTGNNVDQVVDVLAPDASAGAQPPKAVELTPEDFQALVLDPYNPSCTLGDAEDYDTFSITNNKHIVTLGLEEFAFYVNPAIEIRPMAVMVLGQQFDDGEVTIQGDGLEIEDTIHVNLEVPVRTACGAWVWNPDGRYIMRIKTHDSQVLLRYFARERGQKRGAYTGDDALDISMTVETTIAGSNKQLDTSTDVMGRTENGMLVIQLTNKVEDVAPPPAEEDPFADLFADLGLGS